MFEVAVFSLLMLLVLGAVIGAFVHALGPSRGLRRHSHPRIVSRGAIIFFSIDH